ncbi:Ku protein [Noviherbaspirillum massiliense]|uniref:non-homologous end joining protein Ku n=1 Tax=Noviherbaspirillum massiliense TaxID=1465823 RepID=UPI000316A91C|nr:Ku protein [Noviherbaspirillum massiliense]
MSRAIWKGAVSFGLLHAPVALHPATQQDEIDFAWLQKDTLQPVGYKRVVKETGEEIDRDDIIKAVKYKDKYVVLSDEEIRSANVKSTHEIEIVAFTDAEDVNFLFFETPYYLAPTKGGEKVYALLREALLDAGKIGIALVVLHQKQHLAALIPTAQALVLNTLRWATEVRDTDGLELPPAGMKAAAVKKKELEMATQLIESMSEDWDPTDYKDSFRDDIMALVKRKYDEGQAEQISEVQLEEPEESASEADLTELLRQSLQGRTHRPARSRPPSRQAPPHLQKTRHRATKAVH